MRRLPRRHKNPPAPEARYFNYFELGHNAHEFIFDLGQFHPEQAAAQLHMRVVTGPVYAKLLSNLLGQAVERHEREHGVIEIAAESDDPLEGRARGMNGSHEPQAVSAKRRE
jgi:hypothetical protein